MILHSDQTECVTKYHYASITTLKGSIKWGYSRALCYSRIQTKGLQKKKIKGLTVTLKTFPSCSPGHFSSLLMAAPRLQPKNSSQQSLHFQSCAVLHAVCLKPLQLKNFSSFKICSGATSSLVPFSYCCQALNSKVRQKRTRRWQSYLCTSLQAS